MFKYIFSFNKFLSAFRLGQRFAIPALRPQQWRPDRDWGQSVPLKGGQTRCRLLQQDRCMTNPTEPLPPVSESEPATPETWKSEGAISMICNVSSAPAFMETSANPHIPVLAAFGGGRLHTCRLRGSWDLDQLVSDHADQLFRSIRWITAKNAKEPQKDWDDLTFQFGPRSFVYADANRIVGFAATAEEAERMVTDLGKKYHKPKSAIGGGIFHLIQFEGNEIKTREVALSPDTVLKPEAISLHYGPDSGEWHQGFVKTLQSKTGGLTIFEGKPGTGKTFYLRHLMSELKETHRFYFIPTASLGILTKPEFIGFWADQRRHHSDNKFVVVLEDSDGALMTRGTDNREQVSAILNLSDGMLADFLRLQIICTINCSASDIDPALLRPGRLLCHRIFGRLEYAQATRLAESLGRKLPQTRDYSLAEIFAGDETVEYPRPRIGFGI